MTLLSAPRVAGIVLRQFYLMRSSPTRILPMFAWVAIDIILWGFITRYLDRIAPAQTVAFLPMLLGAVLLWDFFSRVMHGVTTAFFEDVWSRNFLNLFASPLGIGDYLAGLIVTGVLTSLISLAVMMLLATAAFGLSMFSLGLMLVPLLFVLFVFGIALGIVACAMVLRLGPASEWLVWPLPAFLSPFVGVFYPMATLPEWMQWIGRLLPPSYVFEGMRATLAGHTPAMSDFIAAYALVLLQLAAAVWLFVTVYRRAVRSGLLARYSAETVS